MINTSIFATQKQTLIVLDMQNSLELPKKFRSTSFLPTQRGVNLQGLANLHVAGSAQFSELGLKAALKAIPSSHVTIVDLREESHGYIDGTSISWFAPGNAINAGKSNKQIAQDETRLLKKCASKKELTIFKIISKTEDERINEAEARQIHVHKVKSEAEQMALHHLNYVRFYVADYHPPPIKVVDDFIDLVRNLSQKEWLYFHCHAGKGRTTTFMALFDMMHNAKHLSFEDVIARQVILSGKNLAKLPEPGSYKYEWTKQRLELLKNFYQYARENEDGFNTSFSKWLKHKVILGDGSKSVLPRDERF